MNEMQVFQNSEFGELGVLTINGKPYFPASACARMLGYSNPRDAIKRHCKEEGVVKHDGVSFTTNQHGVRSEQIVQTNFVTEGNLYRLITHSKLPGAERFERWVFDEVLPSIRKTGGYGQGTAQGFSLEQMKKFAVEVATQVTMQLIPIIAVTVKEVLQAARPMAAEECTLDVPAVDYYTASRCKLETFPPEITNQVDDMLANMQEQQALNFSMIARYCTMSGYAISQPAVKRYFQKRFTKDSPASDAYQPWDKALERKKNELFKRGVPTHVEVDHGELHSF